MIRTALFTARRLVLLLPFLLPLGAHATTRLVLSLEELIGNSTLIFTGTVSEVVVTEVAGVVYSTVHFAIDDVIEGDPALDTIELRFVGGTTAAAHTEVSGQFIPTEGAEGLWFVDDLSRELVNPLTGWSQGYFPIVEKPDGTRWLDLQDHPDYHILAPADALADKMRAFNFPQQQVEAEFPKRLEFPLDDFIGVIDAQVQAR
ncbi:MAG TPA: hypothetical protein VGE69_11275 [Pseudomonadales bacterium]